MGNGASGEAVRTVHFDIQGEKHKVTFSRYSSSQDIHDVLTELAGVSKLSKVTVLDESHAVMVLSATLPENTAKTAYLVKIKEPPRKTDPADEMQVIKTVLSEISQQFTKALKIDVLRKEMKERVDQLEKRIEKMDRMSQDLRALELDKCKKEISVIQEQVQNVIQGGNRNKLDNRVDYSEDGKPKIRMTKALPDFEKYILSKETTEYLKQPKFDIWHWESNEMISLLEHMYHELGIVQHWDINTQTLKRWLLCVQANYRNNPFHNFRHCFCVAQMMYGLIHACKLYEKMTIEDMGVLITACICHDLDHPGYNNTYQINAKTELAIRYNDISPLENHHCSVAFQILSNPEFNILGNLDKTLFKQVRAGIIMLILATDMARHAEIMESFKQKISIFSFETKDHMDTLKMVLIKCCDISNEVRPLTVSEPWVDCLLEEYFNQSDREKEMGLPVAPFMDRDKVTKPTAQIGFIKFVLIPLFESLGKLFKAVDEIMVSQLKSALQKYEELKSEEDITKTIKLEEKKLRAQESIKSQERGKTPDSK